MLVYLPAVLQHALYTVEHRGVAGKYKQHFSPAKTIQSCDLGKLSGQLRLLFVRRFLVSGKILYPKLVCQQFCL